MVLPVLSAVVGPRSPVPVWNFVALTNGLSDLSAGTRNVVLSERVRERLFRLARNGRFCYGDERAIVRVMYRYPLS